MLCLVWGLCFIILKDNQTVETTQKEVTHALCIVTQPLKTTTCKFTTTAQITTSSNVTKTSLSETSITCSPITEAIVERSECVTECVEIVEETPIIEPVCNEGIVEIPVVEPSYFPCGISEDEVTLIASVVETEWNATFDGKVLVAIVILNRINSSQFPNSVHDVLYQQGQFSSVYSAGTPSEETKNAVRDVFSGNYHGYDWLVGSALYFCNSSCDFNSWATLLHTDSYGGYVHKFYR